MSRKVVIGVLVSVAVFATGVPLARAVDRAPALAVVVNNNLIDVTGSDFPASSPVDLSAKIDNGGAGQGTTRSDATGKFGARFSAPTGFAGDVLLSAKSGETTVTKTVHVGAVTTSTTTAVTPTTSLTPTTVTNAPVDSAGMSRVTYETSDAAIPNPERGFYRYSETHWQAGGAGYTALDAATLKQYRQDNVTLVFRYYYLDGLTSQDTIDAAFLTKLDADLGAARFAGVKLVLRFAYVKGGSGPYNAPFGDPPVSRMVSHIKQISPTLNKNKDVIAALQAGFIGLWGEWYYTDINANPASPGTLSDADWQNRQLVLSTLLNSTDPSIFVQVRYPTIKQKAAASSARVGIHDDCFLAGTDDYGTFASDADRQWLADQSKTVPVGGETCASNAPRSEWTNALSEMTQYHWTYLNSEFDKNVLGSWGAGVAEADKRLGYRIAMSDSSASKTAATNAGVNVQVNLNNNGFAAPYQKRPVELVFASATKTYKAQLPVDVTGWQPGKSALAATVCAPADAGTYKLYLNLPDAAGSLANNADYSIQLANKGTWTDNGWNSLNQSVVVQSGSGALPCSIKAVASNG